MKYFDIAWCSKKDGPGTRVVVFLQGCPMHCKWCHSPHSQPLHAPILFYREYCTNCGQCVVSCARRNHCIDERGHSFCRENCIRCGKCVLNCVHGALAYTLHEEAPLNIFEKIKSELMLLKNMGGVTLSGGEPLLQCLQVKELLKLCKDFGIHTAVETSGAAGKKCFEELIPYVDCWLFGLKQTDADLCQMMMGAEHKSIIENLDFLVKHAKKSIIIRTPVIAGYTEDENNMKRIAEIMLSRGLNKIELLPCNPLTEHYYAAAGIKFESISLCSQVQLACLEHFFDEKGIQVSLIS